jgi:hypothetical protein
MAWYQDAGIPVHEKVKKIATRRHTDNFAVSNGWSVTAWYTKSLLEKSATTDSETNDLCWR